MRTIALLLLSTAAAAGWTVETQRDRMTDKAVRWASVEAKESSHGISATLEMTCLQGGRLFGVRLSQPMTRGRMSAKLRSDDGPVRPRTHMEVFSDPYLISLLNESVGRRRFRIELFPTGGPVLFYDFDITGIEKANPCVRPQS